MTNRVLKESIGQDLRDWLFPIYFCVMFAHESIPFLKFGLFVMIIGYSLLTLLKNRCLSVVSLRNLSVCLAWYGIFFAVAYFSAYWQVVPRPESNVLSTMVRIFPICLCIAYYIHSEERLYKMTNYFIFSTAYTSVLALLTSPLGVYGTTSFGGITSLHRNSLGHLCAIVCILSYYMFRLTRKKIYFLPCAIAFITILCTGSRAALLSVAFMAVVGILLEKGVMLKIKWFFAGLGFSLLVVVLYFNIPYLHEVYGERLFALFSDQYSDGGSASDREFYIRVGLEMLQQRPLLGWGIDNFAYYLKEVAGYHYEVYSHNNYIEILTSFGAIGFLVYYWLYVYIVKNSIQRRKQLFITAVLVIILRFILFEYATITFIQYNLMFILITFISAVNLYNYKEKQMRDALTIGK